MYSEENSSSEFLLEILLPHLRHCVQRNHRLTWTKAVITSKWTSPTQIKQSTKIKQRCTVQLRGGRPQTSAAQTRLHTEPTGGPLQLNLSFPCADKQQFSESSESSIVQKYRTWGLRAPAHVINRGQSEYVFTKARNTRNIISFPKIPRCRKFNDELLEYLKIQIHLHVHVLHSCLLKHAHSMLICTFTQIAVIDTLYVNEI